MSKRTMRHLRRLAIQLAGQLPDDQNEALAVLELVKELATDFLGKDDGRKLTNIHAIK